MSDTSFRNYSFQALVLEADPDHYVHDEDIYEFSGDRRFKIDDHNKSYETGGVYGIEIQPAVTVFWDAAMWSMDWDASGDEVLWEAP